MGYYYDDDDYFGMEESEYWEQVRYNGAGFDEVIGNFREWTQCVEDSPHDDDHYNKQILCSRRGWEYCRWGYGDGDINVTAIIEEKTRDYEEWKQCMKDSPHDDYNFNKRAWCRYDDDAAIDRATRGIMPSKQLEEHDKPLAIVTSVSAIVSLISSVLLVWMIFQSKKRFTTTYHRLIVGMAVGDILYSLPLATFQVMIPRGAQNTLYWPHTYDVWNAQGNESSCMAQSILIITGAAITLYYSCSLNIYYLAKVKYNKSDSYIRTKIEPFLHGVPIFIGLLLSVLALIGGGEELCVEISKQPTLIAIISPPPVIIGVSLLMIYRKVSAQEKKISRYGEGALSANAQRNDHGADINRSGDKDRDGSRNTVIPFSSLGSWMKKKFGRKSSSNPNQNVSNSRAVLNKAMAYSTTYFLAWSWLFIYVFVFVARDTVPPLFLMYMMAIFNPLEGFFNFLIYLHPTVVSVKKKQGGDISWRRAFGKAFWAGLTGGQVNPARNGGQNNTPAALAAGGNVEGTAATASITLGGTISNGNRRSSNDDAEEEKTEIEAPSYLEQNWPTSADAPESMIINENV